MNSRLMQPAFTSGEVSPAIAARVDLQLYDSAAQLMRNVVVHPSGGASKAPGTHFIAEVRGSAPCRLIPFKFSAEQTYVLEFTAGHMRVLTKDGLVLGGGGEPVDLPMPYQEADLPGIQYAQKNDVIYLVHLKHAPRKLMRRYDAAASCLVWECELLSFAPKVAAPQNVTAGFSVSPASSGGKKTWRYVVTALDALSGEESLPSAVAEVEGTESMRVGMMLSDGKSMPDWFSTISWARVEGANEYRIYKEKGSGLFGYIGSALGQSFEDKNIAPNMEDTPPVEGNPFAGGNTPGVAAIYQQRTVFGRTAAAPTTFYMSRSGNYENFTKSMFVKDDDYIELSLDADGADPIVWMLPLRSLLIGTSAKVWEVTGGGQKAITPSSKDGAPQSAMSSAPDIQPVVVNNVILHVSRSRKKLQDLVYNFGSDSYDGEDRSLMAAHLFAGRSIKEIAYQESPDAQVWCVMDDGKLLSLTYMLHHQIFAWCQHDSDGAYENVCVLPGNPYDSAFFVVRREVAGQTRRYIELRADPLLVPYNYDTLDDAGKSAVLAQAFFLHSGLSYEGPPVSKLSGLEHLEGKEVAILADGSVEPRQRVVGGKISLGHPAGVIHVGLPYEMQIDTINYEPPGQSGVSIGKARRIAKVIVRVQNSAGFQIGINGQLVETKWRSDEAWGTPPRLHSGVYEYSVPGKWGRESCVSFKSVEPLPFTVNTVVPVVVQE